MYLRISRTSSKNRTLNHRKNHKNQLTLHLCGTVRSKQRRRSYCMPLRHWEMRMLWLRFRKRWTFNTFAVLQCLIWNISTVCLSFHFVRTSWYWLILAELTGININEGNFPWQEWHKRALAHELCLDGWSNKVSMCPGALGFQYNNLKRDHWVELHTLIMAGHLCVIKWSDGVSFLLTYWSCILIFVLQRNELSTWIQLNMVKSPLCMIDGASNFCR